MGGFICKSDVIYHINRGCEVEGCVSRSGVPLLPAMDCCHHNPSVFNNKWWVLQEGLDNRLISSYIEGGLASITVYRAFWYSN